MKKLSQRVVKLLTKKKLKISFAESCTGGLLSSSITSISGSSKILPWDWLLIQIKPKLTFLKFLKK